MSYYNALKSNAPGLTGGVAGLAYVANITSGNYLDIATSSTITQVGAFTYEGWFYPTAFNNGYAFGKDEYHTISVRLIQNNGNRFKINKSYDGGYNAESTDTFNTNTWYHLALTSNGTSTYLYVNGILQATGGAGDLANCGLRIGYYGSPYGGFSGKISNFRYVTGIQVYTGNFTPPTGPLQATQVAGTNISAITGSATKVLTLQNSTAVDNSGNSTAITVVGTVTITQEINNSFGNSQGTIAYDGSKWQSTPIQTSSLAVPVTGLQISGGTSGYVLSTNGSSTLNWITPSSGPTGATGAAGTNGATGAAGTNGATGAAGTNGATGVAGSTGSAGAAGGTTLVFQNSGFNYSVNGFADSTFPTLTLVRGQSYNFNLTNVTSSHPLALRLTSGSTSAVPGTTGNNPTSGVYGTTGGTTYQICGTAGEDGTATLTAPAGATFTSVEFASYGTPSGTCGSFALGGCHATNSLSIVQGYLIGQTGTVNIPATNALFGDPCDGTSKSLAVQATATGTGGGTSVSTIVTYQVPFDAPSVIYYQCVNHSNMIGTINIVDQTGFTGATGPAGATGIGTAGATGVGTPGATGTQGIQGYIGATGSGGSGSGGVGATGATGVGLTGATGPTGPAGPAGSGSGSGGGVTISNTPPASPSVGSFWYVADFGVLSVYVQNGDGTYIWLDIGGKFIPDPEISELLLDGFALGAFADVTPLLLLSAKEGNNL